MKIINKSDKKVSTKGVIIRVDRLYHLTFRKSIHKGNWWDNKLFSFNRNHKEQTDGFSISVMRVALFVGWIK